MMFDVAVLDGATMICHTNNKMKDYLFVLNVSNCYEVA
jgi:translation initiation factor IF-1